MGLLQNLNIHQILILGVDTKGIICLSLNLKQNSTIAHELHFINILFQKYSVYFDWFVTEHLLDKFLNITPSTTYVENTFVHI